ncbi:very short patch repair endonuclease [Anoxybacteroides rupiense]|uniref:very short patch repair endonuclease n=1 Tax=Anoxybacteroides rupiense TaxID=311460 RepID=UPI0036731305
MPDIFSKETRSKIMRSIRSKTKLEDLVCRELWRRGIRFRRNSKDLLGKPDISIKKYKIVIFIDSCFWHYCPIHGHFPKSNSEYWEKKLNRNIQRDEKVNSYYQDNDWNLLRIWEHQIKDDFSETIDHIVQFIENIKSRSQNV